MTSGIYQLTFPSGNFYIGKSVDIEKRWEQHWNKFSKGRHTANMQAEFNKYGDYNCKVIFYCHVDHIDIAEETFISRLRPTLNGTLPADRLEGYYNESFDLICSYFDRSTVEHILELEDCKNRIAVLENYKTAAKAYVASLEKTSEQYEECLDIIQEQKETLATTLAAQKELERANAQLVKVREKEELAADIDNKVAAANLQLQVANSTISSLKLKYSELLAYKNLPWYKKIFN